jgi:hypothetical protein
VNRNNLPDMEQSKFPLARGPRNCELLTQENLAGLAGFKRELFAKAETIDFTPTGDTDMYST